MPYAPTPLALPSSLDPQAVKDSKWREAMAYEVKALEENHTWDMVPLPPGKKAIGSKWVYKVKHKADGSIERYKAPLVAKSYNQLEGENYYETFTPVAKLVSVRVFLAVAAARNWELHQMDVHNAFLHGELHKKVYMRPPPGFSAQKGHVCCLRRSLYGLKQASRNSKACADFKSYLHACFKIKDLGTLKNFLGLEVARSSTEIFLCQRKYALDVLQDSAMMGGAKPASFPIKQRYHFSETSGDVLSDPSQHRRIVGRLLYLTITRPDITYAVHILSQFMQEPRQGHWDAAIRILRYIKSNPGLGLLFPAENVLTPIGYCYSDWVG